MITDERPPVTPSLDEIHADLEQTLARLRRLERVALSHVPIQDMESMLSELEARLRR